jgi:hypothetical protein
LVDNSDLWAILCDVHGVEGKERRGLHEIVSAKKRKKTKTLLFFLRGCSSFYCFTSHGVLEPDPREK